MASHTNDDDLPMTWPFTLAGLCLLLALTWFCLGFAYHDSANLVGPGGEKPDPEKTLPAHFQLFWGLLIAGVLFCLAGVGLNRSKIRPPA